MLRMFLRSHVALTTAVTPLSAGCDAGVPLVKVAKIVGWESVNDGAHVG